MTHKELLANRAAYMRRWLEAHPDKAEQARMRHKALHVLHRHHAVTLLGGKCKHCGFSDYRALQIDHVQGDGYKDRNSKGNSGHAYTYYKKIVEDPSVHERYQILCANCNWIKKHENKEVGKGNRLMYEERQARKAEVHLD